MKIMLCHGLSSSWLIISKFLYSEIKTTAMLKIGNLKAGDIIIVNDEGVMRDGTVVSVSHEENQALVDNGVQEFWYSQDEMFAIPLDEGQLMQLGFTKEESD